MDLEDPACVERAVLLPSSLLSQHWEEGIVHSVPLRRMWEPRAVRGLPKVTQLVRAEPETLWPVAGQSVWVRTLGSWTLRLSMRGLKRLGSGHLGGSVS